MCRLEPSGEITGMCVGASAWGPLLQGNINAKHLQRHLHLQGIVESYRIYDSAHLTRHIMSQKCDAHHVDVTKQGKLCYPTVFIYTFNRHMLGRS